MSWLSDVLKAGIVLRDARAAAAVAAGTVTAAQAATWREQGLFAGGFLHISHAGWFAPFLRHIVLYIVGIGFGGALASRLTLFQQGAVVLGRGAITGATGLIGGVAALSGWQEGASFFGGFGAGLVGQSSALILRRLPGQTEEAIWPAFSGWVLRRVPSFRTPFLP